ncbi:MAG: hypothetical protein K8F53_01405 [Rhodocyclaceae bacterium]|nr:hypothetical protein [Rhodocyclaceae bacterium]
MSREPGAIQPVYFGEKVYFGGGAVFGESERNAVIMHQQNSSEYPTPGVSTTPIYENAVRYATHKGRYSSGVVYKIDTALLAQYAVIAYPVSEYATKPAIPEDEEIILVASNFGVLPDGIIVDVVDV